MTDLAAPAVRDVAPAPISRRQVAAAVIGNALEFYDFTVYAFFAREIGRTFFPGHSPFLSLILSLATFGAGFILRPIGSVVIGRYADRRGRKPAMLLSFALMGAAILALSITPSYAQIGVAAPILVLAWRMAQGFALGGEVGPTTAFLIEASPAARRGLYGAWQGASQN
ncbi:MAG: MFS transporter, partial [Caulobacteraceae bacterium]